MPWRRQGKAVLGPLAAALRPSLGWRCSDGYGVPCKELGRCPVLTPVSTNLGCSPLGASPGGRRFLLAHLQQPYHLVPTHVGAAWLRGGARALQSSDACGKGKGVRSPLSASRQAVDEISFPFFSLHQLGFR